MHYKLEKYKKNSVSELNIFFKFDTENLISKRHYFEQIFKYKFSKTKQLIRFNIKAFFIIISLIGIIGQYIRDIIQNLRVEARILGMRHGMFFF
jgi:hypothetical protein